MVNITKEKFMAYRRVQMSGKYNMFMEAYLAIPETGLTNSEYIEIIENYKTYYDMYCKN